MPKIVDHDQRRREIAAAVLRVIARDGVRGADLRSIASESSWSTGVIAHYFGDKQNLLLGALREAMRHVAEAMADIGAGKADMARLTAMLEAGMPLDPERAATCRIFYHFAAEGMHDPLLSEELANYYLWWRHEVADVIETLQAEGHFPQQPAAVLAETLIALSEGLAIQGMFSGDGTTPDRLRIQLANALAQFDARTTTQGAEA
jgi:AcrR family transcriptional regulator